MDSEKVYKFNEYCLCYDKGHKDRSCLQIIKVQGDLTNTKIYVMGGVYDESADVISMILDNLENEIDSLKDQVEWWKQQCDDLEMQVGEDVCDK